MRTMPGRKALIPHNFMMFTANYFDGTSRCGENSSKKQITSAPLGAQAISYTQINLFNGNIHGSWSSSSAREAGSANLA